jgi:undecaprenyl-diphosphatase
MLPTLVFFLLKSLQGKVQANWALPAYISGIGLLGIELATGWGKYGRLRRGTVYGGFVLAVLLTALSHYPSLVDLPPKLDPSSRLRGWEELGIEVTRITAELERPFFIFSDRYQITSELAFYVKGHPVTYCINRGRRMNQYDLWPGFHELKGYNAVFVTYGDTMPEDLIPLFDRIEKRVFRVKEGEQLLRTYTILIGQGFRGMKKRTIERF